MSEDKQQERVELDDATAQDVIDALRLAFAAQPSSERRARLTDVLLEYAPETASDRGVDLLLAMISEGLLKVEAAS